MPELDPPPPPPLPVIPPYFAVMREAMERWVSESLGDFTRRLRALTGDENITADYLFYIYSTDPWYITFFYGTEPNTPLDPSPGMFSDAKEQVTRPTIYVPVMVPDADCEGCAERLFVRLDEDILKSKYQLGALLGLAYDGDIVLVAADTPPYESSLNNGFGMLQDNLTELAHGLFKPLGSKFIVPLVTDETISFDKLIELTGKPPEDFGL